MSLTWEIVRYEGSGARGGCDMEREGVVCLSFFKICGFKVVVIFDSYFYSLFHETQGWCSVVIGK